MGLTYKNIPIKPSILKNMENILGESKIEKFIEDAKDNLYIEDLSGRLLIAGNYPSYNIGEFISGIPISIKGKLDKNGIFIFDDYLFYENDKGINNNQNNYEEKINKQNEEKINLIETKNEEENNNILSCEKIIEKIEDHSSNIKNLILFISNLNFGKFSNSNDGLKQSIINLLIDFIQNQNNINNTLFQFSNRICRIILVGNSLNTYENEIEKNLNFNLSSLSLEDINSKIIDNYSLFNKFLNIISNYIYIDVMPSLDTNDDLKFPQNPLNKLLFNENISYINYSSLKLVSNPYFFDIYIPSKNKKKYFIGTSGENVNIIKQHSCFENNIDVMKKNIEWRHLSPINPSYSSLYSFDNQTDPLIINKLPDIYFISGNKELLYEKIKIDYKEIFLLSLPDFNKTSKCVLYNYEDDSIKEIDFSFNF